MASDDVLTIYDEMAQGVRDAHKSDWEDIAEALAAEIERLQADLVWAVRKGVMVSHDENLRPCVWLDLHRGVECDGTPDSICRAVRSAREERTDGE